MASLLRHIPGLSTETATRLVRNYGTLAETHILSKQTGSEHASLGALLGADLYEREVDYLIDHEWARNAQDILWRRSKLGLRFTDEDISRLEDYITRRLHHNAPDDRSESVTEII